MKRAVTYYRVSTKRQGQSGLGLEAQRKAIESFVSHNDYVVDDEFIEVESGNNNKRQVLEQALKTCRKEGATLLIAKLDRLSRNVKFIATLVASGVEFIAVDNPHAPKLLVHIMAAFAEEERDSISKRTKEALRAAKARGVVIGIYGRDVLSKRNKVKAVEFALCMKPTIESLRSRGITSTRAIAKELNRLKIPTYSKAGRWHKTTVHSLLKRLHEA